MIPFYVVVYAVFALLLLRYGIVPLIVGVAHGRLPAQRAPHPRFLGVVRSSSIVAVLVFLAIAVYGFRCAVAGRPLFEME